MAWRSAEAHEHERAALLLGTLAVLGIALADVLTGSDIRLTGYLVLGPLIAAAGARPRYVAGVALLALAVAVPLGAANHIFGEAPHWVILGLVAVGGAVAV